MTANSTLQHLLYIDDRKTTYSSPSTSTYFSFDKKWNISGSAAFPHFSIPEGSDSGPMPRSGKTTVSAYSGVLSENMNLGDELEVTVRFNGTDIALLGQIACFKGQAEVQDPDTSNFSVTFDDYSTEDYSTEEMQTHDTRYFVNTTGTLGEASFNTTHKMELNFSSLCLRSETGTLFNVFLDAAFVTLAPDSVIEGVEEQGEEILMGLVAFPNDPFIVYEGHWDYSGGSTLNESAIQIVMDNWGKAAMETPEVGASLSFTFFGSAIVLFGDHNPLRKEWTILISLDDNAAIEVKSSPDGPIYISNEVARMMNDDVIFQATNLTQTLPDGRPHSINVTVLEGVSVRSPFGFQAFLYPPTFSTLAEGNSMFETWRSTSAKPTTSNLVSTAGSRHAHRTAAISAGVLGGLTLVSLLAVSTLWWFRRKKRLAHLRQLVPGPTDSHNSQTVAAIDPRRDSLIIPYMKAVSAGDDNVYADGTPSSLASVLHGTEIPSRDRPSPYTKSYYDPRSSIAELTRPPEPGRAVPYTKHYDLEVATQALRPPETSLIPIRRDSEELDGSNDVPAETMPSPIPHSQPRSLRSISSRDSENISIPASPTMEYTQQEAPPSFVSREPDSQDTPEDGQTNAAGGPGTPATTRRLMRIIESMRVRMDAMEPPPPYNPDRDSHAYRDNGQTDEEAGEIGRAC